MIKFIQSRFHQLHEICVVVYVCSAGLELAQVALRF